MAATLYEHERFPPDTAQFLRVPRATVRAAVSPGAGDLEALTLDRVKAVPTLSLQEARLLADLARQHLGR